MLFVGQKHREELFPPLAPPTPESLTQAALFVVLSDSAASTASTSGSGVVTPWTSLAFGRLGNEAPTWEFTFDHEAIPATRGEEAAVTSKSVVLVTPRRPISNTSTITSFSHQASELSYDIIIKTTTLPDDHTIEHAYTGVRACLNGESNSKRNLIVIILGDERLQGAVVRQAAPNPRSPPTTSNTERLHVFSAGTHTTLVRPPPSWQLSLSSDVLNAAKSKGGVRAPMPSLVVDVKVAVGEDVKKGQAVVILESMKTETVLRAERDGKVKALSCTKGEMVDEGRELVLFEEEKEES
jgi:3-methylcrotonyl-CoA carboxylase alpha subunit